MDRGTELRRYLARLLDWEDAHVSFDAAVEGIAPPQRGTAPTGLPHSPWQLLEHMRRTQRDILDFCREPAYVERKWPEDYWPPEAAPQSDAAWDESVLAYRRDRETLQAMARDPGVDLLARVPNGDGQTYLRELILASDHTAYHVGQMVLVRRALGIWG
jgi:hypothetical protein